MNNEINEIMQKYIDDGVLANAILIVYKNGEITYRNKWGYSSLEDGTPVSYDSVFRMMSMSKPVTAMCVMKLVEQGKLDLDDPIEKYLPEFAEQKVALAGQYEFSVNRLKLLKYLLTYSKDKVKSETKNRSVTVRDLLSHSSGLQQGMIGLLDLYKNNKKPTSSLKEDTERYSRSLLDFQPGTDTNYSPLAGFNVLGHLVSVISGESLESFMQREICQPLEMNSTSFFLNEDMRNRLVNVYKLKKKLVNVTDSKEDLYGVMNMVPESYEAGSGGLYSTAEDYEHFARMLLNNGVYNGKKVFESQTIELVHSPGAYEYLEKDPGLTWGLGVKIRMDPDKAHSAATKGTYGWSGAFGTHFFVSPEDGLEAVFMTNRSDLDGASSYVSSKVEELVFKNWGQEKTDAGKR